MKIRSTLFSLSAIVLFTSVPFASTAVQQSRERVIRRLPIEKDEPLGITEMKVNGQVISFGQEFVADDDWMKSLVISVKNTSDKRILFAELDLSFPRPTGAKELISMFDLLSYGNHALPLRPPSQAERLAGIAPNKIADIQLSARQFEGLRQFLSDTGYPQGIEKVDLRMGRIIFEDDTMWYVGAPFRRDKDLTSWTHVHTSKSRQP